MATEDDMALDERVAKLDKTMAKGFFDQGQRMDRLEDRMAALDSKFDVVSESIRGDVKAVLEAVTALGAEMRRTTRAIRKEHVADRRITKSVLLDHLTRIRKLRQFQQRRHAKILAESPLPTRIDTPNPQAAVRAHRERTHAAHVSGRHVRDPGHLLRRGPQGSC